MALLASVKKEADPVMGQPLFVELNAAIVTVVPPG
jgi:hypothetical protein